MLAAWVYGYHINLQVHGADTLLHRGYLGVDGFFLLSGMLLAHVHPHLGWRGHALGAFWARRLLRIYPVHLAIIAVLILMLAAAALAGHAPRDPGRFSGRELALNLLLVHGWGFSDRWAWNYPSWSISTEWLGYLAFPFLWRAVRGLGDAAVAGLAVTMLAALAVVARGHGVGLNLTYGGAIGRLLPEFVAGMAVARLSSRIARHVRGWVLSGAGLLWTAAAIATPFDALVVAGLLLALCGLLVSAMQHRPPLLARVPGFETMGRLSYAFYMSFAVVETMLAQAWRALGAAPPEHPLAYILCSAIGTAALALAVHVAVERPALLLGRLVRGGPRA